MSLTLPMPGPALAEPDFDIEALRTPAAFPHPTSAITLRETQLSWIVLTGAFAYKIKKPVLLPFIDCSTLPRRRALCEEELRLNRRLAADLYVDVVGIAQTTPGLGVGGFGRIVEYAVKMRQFDESQLLAALLDGGVQPDEMLEFAALLANFHGGTPRAPSAPQAGADGPTERFRAAVLGTIATLVAHLHDPGLTAELGRLVDWTHDALHELMPLLRQRETDGFVRDCHGDLHAGNIVRWQRRLVPFDCLEFDPNLRWIDVMNDVAFLGMDLCAHGRTDLAASFLDRYLEVTGDYGGIRLLRLYAVYRALVRAMVDAMSGERDSLRKPEFDARLRGRMAVAARLIDRRSPMLILMHGMSGSGKSWLSALLATDLRAIRIRSDIERRRLAVAAATVAAATLEGAEAAPSVHTPEHDRRTYSRLLACAQHCLDAGLPVIVDATFLRRADRKPFEALAARLGIRYCIVDCNADLPTLKRRLEARQVAGTDASDAGLDVLALQLDLLEPLDPGELPHCVLAKTNEDGAAAQTLAALRGWES